MNRPPPGWPRGVVPPGEPDWEQSAVAWLLDVCPPDYRGYPALRRHPQALVWLAAQHVAASRAAMQRSLATARDQLGSRVSATEMTDIVEVLELEQVRLLSVQRSLSLLAAALE